MKKYIFLIPLLLTFSHSAFSQDNLQPEASKITKENWREVPLKVRDFGDTHQLQRIVDRDGGRACYLIARNFSPENPTDMDCIVINKKHQPPENAVQWRKIPVRVRDIGDNATFLRFYDSEIGTLCYATAYTVAYPRSPTDSISCTTVDFD